MGNGALHEQDKTFVSRLVDRGHFDATGSESVLGFLRVGPASNPGFDRYLTVDGRPAYHLGNICNTCEFLFERMDAANRSFDVPTLAERLRNGLSRLEEEVLRPFAAALPSGRYDATLLEIRPRLITPGNDGDYFSVEQPALWGENGFWGLPHHPRTRYYRCGELEVAERERLFEFVVPMFPHGWLDEDTLNSYQKPSASTSPTAVALTTLDVKSPAVWGERGEPAVHTHWCLAHYLLDGHHKVHAAARAGRPISLLSFISSDESRSDDKQRSRVLDLLATGWAT